MTDGAAFRVLSWNVNGLRAVERKGFSRWRTRSGADVIGVQETRAAADQLPTHLARPRGWFAHHVRAERPGYSGVSLYARTEPDAVEDRLGEARFDREGRFQLARFGALCIANVYFPNGNGKERDNGRVPYKLAFYRAVFERLERERAAGRPVLVMGDFNTAHREIDLARPRDNARTSGFLPDERAELDRWLRGGWVDAFRSLHPEPGHYTWWTQRGGCRARNVGWRIDYVLCSRSVLPHLRRAFHQPRVMGSDHCPVGVDLDPAVLGGRR
jgi:exodeoxyribonuclease-3